MKPANAIFLPAPALALAYSRQLRGSLAFAAGLVPSLVCLSLWKYRGLGYLPLFHGSPRGTRSRARLLATGCRDDRSRQVFPGQLVPPDAQHRRHSRVHVESSAADVDDPGRADRSRPAIDRVCDSRRCLARCVSGGQEARRSRKSTAEVSSAIMAPSFPAVFLLGVSIPFLVPVYGRRLAARGDPSGWPVTPRARKGVVAVAGFLSVAPIILLLVFRPLTTPLTTTVPGRRPVHPDQPVLGSGHEARKDRHAHLARAIGPRSHG